MTTLSLFTTLSDADLLSRVVVLAGTERAATAELIAALAEVDGRRLYLGAGCSSLFTYCTQILHLSESAAYARIQAARTARCHPAILERLVAGSLTLTSVYLLAPVLTPANCSELLDAAAHKSKRDVEQLVARVRPQPPVPSVVRKLPARATSAPVLLAEQEPTGRAAMMCGTTTILPARQPTTPRFVVQPLAPEMYKVQFTLSREGHGTLRRAQDLLRHSVPTGDVAAIFERALKLLVEDLERSRLAATARPQRERQSDPRSRHIPSAVKRAVWRRDRGRCAFVGTEGRCTERGLLQIHHLVPFADGGETTEGNLQLRCAAHNRHEADLWFGPGGAGSVREQSQPHG